MAATESVKHNRQDHLTAGPPPSFNAGTAQTQPVAPCDISATALHLWRATVREPDGRIQAEAFGNREITNREYTDPRGYLTKIETIGHERRCPRGCHQVVAKLTHMHSSVPSSTRLLPRES